MSKNNKNLKNNPSSKKGKSTINTNYDPVINQNSGLVMFKDGLNSLKVMSNLISQLNTIKKSVDVLTKKEQLVVSDACFKYLTIIKAAKKEAEQIVEIAGIKLSTLTWLSLITSARYVSDMLSSKWLNLTNRDRYSLMTKEINKAITPILSSYRGKIAEVTNLFVQLAKTYNDIRYLNDRRDMVKNPNIVVSHADSNVLLFIDKVNLITKLIQSKDDQTVVSYSQLIPSNVGKPAAETGLFFTFDNEGRLAIKHLYVDSHGKKQVPDSFKLREFEEVRSPLKDAAYLNDLLILGRPCLIAFYNNAVNINEFIAEQEKVLAKKSLKENVKEVDHDEDAEQKTSDDEGELQSSPRSENISQEGKNV